MARLTMKQLDELHDEYTRDADYPEFRDIHDLLDTVDALESEKALERAAVLREAAECTHTNGENATWKSGEASHRAICALIPQVAAHALDKLLVKARLEEAREWKAHRPGDGFYDRRVSELEAAAKKVAP